MSLNDELPEGALIETTMVIRIPVGATRQQVEEWIRFGLNDNGSLPAGNPLAGYDVEPWGFGSFTWKELGQIGHTERVLRSSEPGGKTFGVKYHRLPY